MKEDITSSKLLFFVWLEVNKNVHATHHKEQHGHLDKEKFLV